MPIASAAFLIVFANLAGSADLTQPHGGAGPHDATSTTTTEDPETGIRDVIRTCAPGVDFCSDLHKECSGADLSLSDCDTFGKLCEVDACAACEATIDRCLASGDTNCDYVEQHCAALGGCCSTNGPNRDPSGWLKGCAPDVNMCDLVGDACLADGLDPEVCEGIRANICPADRYMSCKALEKVCEDEGNDCGKVIATCDAELDGCPASKCHDAGTLTPGQAVALCFAYPSRLATCDGEEPDASHCMSLMTWDGCEVSSCQWIECEEELAQLGDMCPTAMPLACVPVMACDAAEQNDANGSCCEEFGNVDGKPDTCNASESNFCVGCSYEPVLCMTHGCVLEGEEDCCLSPDGETVPC